MSHEALQRARRAIEIERARHTRPGRLTVLDAERVAPRVARVRIASEEPPDPQGWVGGTLRRDVGDGLPNLYADVLEVDPDTDSLYVQLSEKDELPEPGPAVLWLFDYLRSPWLLLTHPRYHHLLDRFEQRLGQVLHPRIEPLVGSAGLEPAWRHRWVCVWGPPGTGKTHTLVHQAAELLRDPAERVLLVSTTNRATDEIALRLGGLLTARDGLDGVVRLGTVVRPGDYSDAGLMGMLPDSDLEVLEALVEVRQALTQTRRGASRALLLDRLSSLQSGQISLSTRPDDPAHRCVVTTLYGAVRALVAQDMAPLLEMGRPPFTTVVIDEAGLVSRVQAAAVSLLSSRRVVLVGDPRQLSPIAKAARSMPREVLQWVARSGLDHLGTQAQPHVQRLCVQRRMHPEIRRAVSALSYDGSLVDAEGLAERTFGAPSLLSAPRAVWFVLDELGVSRPALSSTRGPDGRSRMRRLATRVLASLLEVHPELAALEVLFVTPFRAQRDFVDAWIQSRALPWRAATVHAQQGSEADVVVFDTVHASSTTWPAVEWVRLVNVGLSRARHLVVLLASRSELDQPWLRPLRSTLTPRVLRLRGEVLSWETVPAVLEPPRSLFATPDTVAPVAAEASVEVDHRDVRLGAQIARRRTLRPVLSQEQARLIHRELADAGPRLVRGVAGSGKTLVLAHWLVRLLHGQGVPRVLVVYANRALRHLLEDMIDHAWNSMHPVPGPFPWERVDIVHLADLLESLLAEHELAPPGGGGDKDVYDYSHQASRLLALPLEERLPPTFIDEAQDFGHETLELVVRLGTTTESGRKPVLVFYDNVQDVYGRGAPRWREIGLDIRGRSDVMRESFRSTRPNVELALDVLHQLRPLDEDTDFRELIRDGLLTRGAQGWQAHFCAIDGQPPVLKIFDTREEEIALICRQVHAWVVRDAVHPGDIRVLALKNTRDALLAGLRRHLRGHADVVARTTQGFADAADAVVVTTPHSFKGHDAEIVVVAGAEGYATRGRALHAPLYVALTRARTLLLLTATRAEPGTVSARVVEALEATGRA